MELNVTLPKEDVEFLDQYAKRQGYASRSAVVREAVRLLRGSELGTDYAGAWDEWAASDETSDWETTLDDGLTGG